MADDDSGFGRRVAMLGSLADPVRRALYRFVSDQPGAVSRVEAADGVDVAHHTAKFHLDKLVDEGLLVTEFRRLTGRTGPGAGRPAKLYRRARREVAVSLPHRRYDLAADVLAGALERCADGVPLDVAVAEAAGRAARVAVDETSPGGPAADTDPLEQVAATLGPLGFEPRVEEAVDLGNCPFDRLASDHPGLVCGMNRAFVAAVVEDLAGARLEVQPTATDREAGGAGCCVRVVRAHAEVD